MASEENVVNHHSFDQFYDEETMGLWNELENTSHTYDDISGIPKEKEIETKNYIIDKPEALQQLIKDLRENNSQTQNMNIEIHDTDELESTDDNDRLFKDFCIALQQNTMIQKLKLEIDIPLSSEQEESLLNILGLHHSIIYLSIGYTKDFEKTATTLFWKNLSQNKTLEELELDIYIINLEHLGSDIKIFNDNESFFNLKKIILNNMYLQSDHLILGIFLLKKSINLESLKFIIADSCSRFDRNNELGIEELNELKNNLKENLSITNLVMEFQDCKIWGIFHKFSEEFGNFQHLYLTRNHLIKVYPKFQ